MIRRFGEARWGVEHRVSGGPWQQWPGTATDRKEAEAIIGRAAHTASLAGWPYEYRIIDERALASRLRWYTLR